jgi:hypothetical protein
VILAYEADVIRIGAHDQQHAQKQTICVCSQPISVLAANHTESAFCNCSNQ